MKTLVKSVALVVLLIAPQLRAATPASPVGVTSLAVRDGTALASMSGCDDGNMGVRINFTRTLVTADNMRQCTIVYFDMSDSNGRQKLLLATAAFFSGKQIRFTIDAMAGLTYCHATEAAMDW